MITLILGAYLFTGSAFVYAYNIEKSELSFQVDVIARLTRIETRLPPRVER
jgi:hypothetical protein